MLGLTKAQRKLYTGIMRKITMVLIVSLIVGAVAAEGRADTASAQISAYPALARKVGGQKTRLQYRQNRKNKQQKAATAVA